MRNVDLIFLMIALVEYWLSFYWVLGDTLNSFFRATHTEVGGFEPFFLRLKIEKLR